MTRVKIIFHPASFLETDTDILLNRTQHIWYLSQRHPFESELLCKYEFKYRNPHINTCSIRPCVVDSLVNYVAPILLSFYHCSNIVHQFIATAIFSNDNNSPTVLDRVVGWDLNCLVSFDIPQHLYYQLVIEGL